MKARVRTKESANMWLRNALHLGCVVAVITCAPLEATEVLVRGTSGELGQGHLRVANGKCYVVTAGHLVAGSREFTVIRYGAKEASATLADSGSSDVAILKISNLSFCEEVANPSIKGLDQLLETETSGKLELVQEDGTLVRADVEIKAVGRNQITIESTQVLAKGVSGSTLVVHGRPSGMVSRSEGKRAAVIPMTLVETVWNRYVGNIPNCDDGCEVALKTLSQLDHAEQDDTSINGMVKKRVDYIYQFPENWPTPPFFHVIKEASIINLPGVLTHSEPLKVTSFSFSKSPTPFAQDVRIPAGAFDGFGEVREPFNKGLKSWWIRVTGTSNISDIVVSIEKPAPLFGETP